MRFRTVKTYLKKIPYLHKVYLDLYKYFYLKKEGEILRRNLDNEASLENKVDLVLNNKYFHSSQKRTEILQFLNLIKKSNPRIVCEIGTRKGGTLILLSRAAAPDATLISIDLKYPSKGFTNILKGMILPSQKLVCIQKSSTDPKTEKIVEKLLGERKIDLLFIDGDHSYDGVSKDYTRFKKYVGPSGIIAFHDIHPDSLTLFGIKTESYVGDVPKFWREITVAQKLEYIEDSNQDGCGIGLLVIS